MIPAQTPTAVTPQTPVASPTRTPALLELVALDSLPCGCVAAAYRARPWDLAVVSLEAKGPHCPNGLHAQGRVLELGVVSDLLSEDDEE
jgi:hypothetical protein